MTRRLAKRLLLGARQNDGNELEILLNKLVRRYGQQLTIRILL